MHSVKPHQITRSDRIDETDFELGLPQVLLEQQLGGRGLEEEQADWLLGDAYYGAGGEGMGDGGTAVGVGMGGLGEEYFYDEDADPTLLRGLQPEHHTGLPGPSDLSAGDDMDTSGSLPEPEPRAPSRPGSAQGDHPAGSPAGSPPSGGGGLSSTQAAEFFSSGPPPLMDVPMLEMASELPVRGASQTEDEPDANPPPPSAVHGGLTGVEEAPRAGRTADEESAGEGAAPAQAARKKEPMRIDSGRAQISTQQLTAQLGDASALVRDVSGPSHAARRRHRGSTSAAATPSAYVWLAPGRANLLCQTPAIERLVAHSAQQALASPAPSPHGSPPPPDSALAIAADPDDPAVASPPAPPPPEEERFRSHYGRPSSFAGFAQGDDTADLLDPTLGSAPPEGEMRSGGVDAEAFGAGRPPRLPSMAGDEPPGEGGGLDFGLGLDVDALGVTLPLEFGYGDGLERLEVGDVRDWTQGPDPPTGDNGAPPPAQVPSPGSPAAESPTEDGRYSLPSQPMLVELMRALRALPADCSVNLNRSIMRGRPRREAARLLFNALVLASHDRVILAQEAPYAELWMGRGGAFASSV